MVDVMDLEKVLAKLNAAIPEHEADMASVERTLRALHRQRFCGVVELTFQDGHVILLRKNATTRPTGPGQSGQPASK